LSSLLIGVRKVKEKPTRPERGFLKFFRFKLYPQLLRRVGRFNRTRRVAKLPLVLKFKISLLKKVIRTRAGGLYKLIRFRSLRGQRAVPPYSGGRMPFGGSIVPLTKVWTNFFLKFSRRERSNLASLRAPSLPYLLRVVGLLERVSLLISGATLFKGGSRPIVEESLFLLKENTGGAAKLGIKTVDSKMLILNFITEGSHIEPWPRVSLRPLLLTHATISPLASTHKHLKADEAKKGCCVEK